MNIAQIRLLCGLLTTAALPAKAVDINISGLVVASPCVVDTTSVNQTVEFGQLLTTDFKTAGSAGAWKAFSLLLTHCPASTTRVTTVLTGTPAATAGYFANSGTATDAVLQLTNADYTTTYTTGSTIQILVDSAREATFPLAARVVSPNGTMGPGTFESLVQVDFTYQ